MPVPLPNPQTANRQTHDRRKQAAVRWLGLTAMQGLRFAA
jgi:hypothetical protein